MRQALPTNFRFARDSGERNVAVLRARSFRLSDGPIVPMAYSAKRRSAYCFPSVDRDVVRAPDD